MQDKEMEAKKEVGVQGCFISERRTCLISWRVRQTRKLKYTCKSGKADYANLQLMKSERNEKVRFHFKGFF